MWLVEAALRFPQERSDATFGAKGIATNGAKMLLGAPGLTTRNKRTLRNKSLAPKRRWGARTKELAMRYSDEDYLKESLELSKTAGIDEAGRDHMCNHGCNKRGRLRFVPSSVLVTSSKATSP